MVMNKKFTFYIRKLEKKTELTQVEKKDGCVQTEEVQNKVMEDEDNIQNVVKLRL